jgi:hypothetical protein
MSEIRFLWTLTALPADPAFVVTEEALACGLDLMGQLVPASRHLGLRFDEPRFFGSERFSSSASCPVCGATVGRDEAPGSAGRRWFTEVDTIGACHGMADTSVTMPGCGHEVPVGAVAFEFPTGAARCALTAHFEVWSDEWFSQDAQAPAEPLQALSSALCTPLLFVRSLTALLPQDRLTLGALVSSDDDVRLAAAHTLDALPPGHFEDNSIALGSSALDYFDGLLAAWRETAHPDVRRWVLYLLGESQDSSDAVYAVLDAELRSPGETLEMALHACHRGKPEGLRPLVPLIRPHHAHHDAKVRWRCALALRHLRADGPEDRSLFRLLAFDRMPSVRNEAIGAMQAWIENEGGRVGEEDHAVLTRVAALFPRGDSAHHLARKLLSGEDGIRDIGRDAGP